MQIKLIHPFEYDGIQYDFVAVPDYLQLGHRRIYAKYKGLQGEEVGIALCAALCEIPEPAFDRISITDFELVTQAVKRLFGESSEKKRKPQQKRRTLRR